MPQRDPPSLPPMGQGAAGRPRPSSASPARQVLDTLIANPWMKLLSFVIATVTWLYVQGEEVREDRVKAQIAWSLPSDLVATEALPTSAHVVVRGTRSAVNNAHKSAVRLVVDVSDLSAGEHEVDLAGIPAEGLPPSVERLAVSPAAVRFELDKVAAHSVRIRAVLVGEPAPGYSIGEAITDPQVIEVRGPRETVSSLREVLTRPIDVSGLDGDVERVIELDLPRGVDLSGAATVRAEIHVRSSTEQRRIEGIPVFVAGGGKASPDRIDVVLEGAAQELRAVEVDQVVAIVRLPNALESELEVWYGPNRGPRVEVLHPGATTVRSMSPPSITVRP